jgi:hypothetical protein
VAGQLASRGDAVLPPPDARLGGEADPNLTQPVTNLL